jgi:hypothetical protein
VSPSCLPISFTRPFLPSFLNALSHFQTLRPDPQILACYTETRSPSMPELIGPPAAKPFSPDRSCDASSKIPPILRHKTPIHLRNPQKQSTLSPSQKHVLLQRRCVTHPPPLKTLVGRTPWSAADAPVGLFAWCRILIPVARAGPGGPARTRGSALHFGAARRARNTRVRPAPPIYQTNPVPFSDPSPP